MNELQTIPLLLEYVCQRYKKLPLFTLYDAGNKAILTKSTYQDLPPLIKEFQSLLPIQATRIVIYLDSGPEWLKVFFAIVCGGHVAVLIDGGLDPEYVLQQVKQSEALLLITDNKRLHKIEEAKISDQLPAILNVNTPPIQNYNIVENTINISPISLAAIIYTSGSTGNPKGIMLSHQAFCSSAALVVDKLTHIPHGFNTLVILPLWHISGLANCALSFMLKGCSMYFIQTMNPESIFATLKECRIYHMSATPIFCEAIYKALSYGIIKLPLYERGSINSLHNMCKFMLKYSQKNAYRIAKMLFKGARDKISPSFCSIATGGARLNPEIIEELLGFGYVVLQGYGLSEACGGIAYTNPFDYRANCVGTFGLGCAVKILNQDENDIGEICLKGIQLMDGYLNQPELTKVSYTDDGWFRTGDLGYLDKEQQLYISGRSKDIIVTSGGKNIFPDDVEHYFSHIPHVDEVCVYGQQTDNGEEVVLVVRPSDTLKEEQIKQVLNNVKDKNATLPTYYQARQILLAHDNLPRTAARKIDRQKVKALLSKNKLAEVEYLAPRNKLEIKFCKVFAEVLGLSVNNVGMTSDFFGLGGNSILALELVSKLNQAFNLKLTIAEIFKYKTIRSILERSGNNASNAIIIPKSAVVQIEDQVLSFAQERFLFLELLQNFDNTAHNNIPMAFRLNDSTNPEILIKSIKKIVNRHEVLRSLIKSESNTVPYQVVLNDVNYPLEINMVQLFDDGSLDNTELKTQICNAANYIFKLDKEYPIHVHLYEVINQANKHKINKDLQITYYISIVIHHIAFDGWSTNIFLKEMHQHYEYYNAIANGDLDIADEIKKNIPKLGIQYKDFAVWQKQYLQKNELSEQVKYWKNKLLGYEVLNIITDKPRTRQISYDGNNIEFKLNNTVSVELKQLAKNLSVSMYSVLLSACYMLLRSYSNQDDILIAGFTANRHYDSVNNLIGCFINILPLREIMDAEQDIVKFIQQVGVSNTEAQQFQDLPYEIIVEEMKKITGEHLPVKVLFEVVINNDTYGTIVEPFITDNNITAQWDLRFSLMVGPSNVDIVVNYATSLFNEDTICRYITTYAEILEQVAKLKPNDQMRLKDLYYLNQDDYQKVIHTWNATEKKYQEDKTIHQLFEEQVERTPDNIAVVYEDTKLTYKELNNKANQLAHYLRTEYKIQGDDLIALCLDRSEHMLIAILSTLKSGGAYVPMDSGYPDERIKYILEDTRAKVVLTNDIHQDKLSSIISKDIVIPAQSGIQDHNIVCDVCIIDNAKVATILKKQASTNLTQTIASNNLAYVIYTSGTTGKPKGVMLQHQGIINRITWMNDEYALSEEDRILQKTPYVFDVSVWELFWANWYGASIVFAKAEGHKDTKYLLDLMEEEKITVLHFVPSMLEVFDQALKAEMIVTVDKSERIQLSSLRYIFCSGEALNLNQVKLTQNLLPKVEIHNLYGPTEASVDVLYYDCTNKEIPAVYIGRPIFNTKSYILDASQTPVPIGAIGELYIGGAGLARGYLNQPELTKERFIANPFQTEVERAENKNTRLYKTGDLVCYLPDGNIEYIGRNDFQVKIRGFRIELGEIESKLAGYPEVKQAVALTREHYVQKTEDGGRTPESAGNKYLVGYYVSENKLDEDEILKHLGTQIPDYMIPSALVWLDKLPLTINGKLDRKALPDPEFTSTENYVAPRNELESKVCEVFAEVLNLPVDKVGITGDFFRLGGNSILAIKLLHEINKVINKHISVIDVFKYKTVESLSICLSQDLSPQITIPKIELDKYPLSFAQERLWFIEAYENGTNAYHVPILLLLSTKVSIADFKAAIRSVVERHEVLRSIFKQDEGIGYQVILNKELEIKEYSFDNEIALNNQIDLDINTVFNLELSYPMRVCIYELNKVNNNNVTTKNVTNHMLNSLKNEEVRQYYLLINMHHIAADAWSLEIFQKELNEYYNHYNEGLQLNLPQLDIQYKDFAIWQRNYLGGIELERQLSYWKSRLNGYETLNIATDKPRPKDIEYAGDAISFSISKELSNKLKHQAQENSTTLFTVLLTGFYILLHKYSLQTDIVVGTPIANREYYQIKDLIGFFANTLVLRETFNIDYSGMELLTQIQNNLIEVQRHQDLPFEKLVEELGVVRDASRHPIFQAMFRMQNFIPQRQDIVTVVPFEHENKTAKFDLYLTIDDSASVLKGNLNYRTNLYNQDTIKRMVCHYEIILGYLSDNLIEKIKNYNVLTPKEYQKIVYEWNQTERDYPSDKTIHQLFEEQVERTPDGVAVVYEETKLTYRELNERSNQLANYLRTEYKIKGDDLIALCLDRSEYIIIGILAVLKSGGAYVPIDINYPDARIIYMLEDVNTKVILTNAVYTDKFNTLKNSIIKGTTVSGFIGHGIELIDGKELNLKLKKYPIHNLMNISANNNLMYVIFTSGTTGNPKGVMTEHQNMMSYSSAIIAQFSLDESYRSLLLTEYVFGLGYTNIYPILLSGGSLHLISKDNYLESKFVVDYIKNNQINFIKVTPLYAESMLLSHINELTSIRYLLLGGESASKTLLEGLEKFNFQCIRHYGSTEITVGIIINEHFKSNELSCLGKPIFNTRVYVLDSNLTPVPLGVAGELYVGGDNVTRGYLHQEELTKERFIANPFQSEAEKQQNKNSKLYKTGDLVRYLADGDLEYLGRNDFQIKIRGYRVELSEIEAAIQRHEDITKAVVLYKDDGMNSRLIAYLVCEEFRPLVAEIKEFLQEQIPDYMMPHRYIFLDKFPLTINGKLDRKALPEPEFINVEAYVAPQNKQENEICSIYAEILNLPLDKVGIKDDFFKLGGNSILAIKLSYKIGKVVNKHVAVADIFKYKTVELLSKHINEESGVQIVIPKVKLDKYPLSFAQERLWFIEEYAKDSHAYNIPFAVKIHKSTNLDALEQAIHSVVSRHEILHSLIKTDAAGNGYQEVCNLNKLPFIINKQKISSRKELDNCINKEMNHVYKLEEEYSIRVSMLINNLPESFEDLLGYGDNYLCIVIHHIAFDGWSIDVFLRDLQTYYNYYNEDKLDSDASLHLPELSIQYEDFAVWQREYLSGDRLEKQLSYWKSKLSDYEGLNLPLDKVRPPQTSYAGDYVHFNINEVVSAQLKELAKQLNVSLYSVLLSGYYILLSGYSNQTDIVIGTPIANRHYYQLENMIGFFANSLVLRSKLNKDSLLTTYIEEVGKDAIDAQLHQDLPFEKLVAELNVIKDTSRNPIFQVMFGVQSFGNASAYKEKLFELYHSEDGYKVAKVDLITTLDDSEDKISGFFNYATSIFNRKSIEYIARTYQNILEQIAKISVNDQTCLKDLHYLNQEDYEKVIYTWNATEKEYPNNKTFHQLFEEQVLKTPNNIAVIYENTQLTYQELNVKANQLANYLRNTYQIVGDDLIALCLDRSEYTIIAIMAVLKSGAAYVPMDPSFPDERIAYTLVDTKAKVLLTNKNYESKINAVLDTISNSNRCAVCFLDTIQFQDKLKEQFTTNLPQNITSKNLAYVIYTSGTTGKPKGVMIEHAQLNELVYGFTNKLQDLQKSPVKLNTLSLANYVFDVFVSEYSVPLLYGYYIDLININDFLNQLCNIQLVKYDYIQVTPSKIELFLFQIDSNASENKTPVVINLLIGGEALKENDIKLIHDYEMTNNYITFELINVYGPTEATVWSTMSLVSNNNKNIGKPLYNETIYVLNDNLTPVPLGAKGELYIGGDGVGRGYLNQSELTIEKFIPNPFQTLDEKAKNKNARLYKTGDLVRMLLDGNIEYIGRNDFQVKIRGYRIELGEIESVLSSYSGIKQAVVIAKNHKSENDDGKYLVGYYVSEEPLDEEEVLRYLSGKLTDYMLPSILVWLEKLPLTINGKLDIRLLPAPEFVNMDTYVAPHTGLEAQIVQIWSDLLGLEQKYIGVKDNFFKLGGNSILIIKLKSQLANIDCFKTISVADLFKYHTIEKLIVAVSEENNDEIKLQQISTTVEHEIAIIAMSGSFSGCADVESFWNIIETKREGIREYSLNECRELSITEDLLQNKDYVAVSGQIPDIDLFDPLFWDISANEAKQTNPHIRKFIEHAWYALEQSGYLQERHKLNIGVFAGGGGDQYFFENILNGVDADDINLWSAYNMNSKDALATKVSYFLGLTGPANSINTACSTGLVTVIEACKNVASGICDMALAGSVSLAMPDQIGYVYQEGMILSKDGHCRSFDKNASGTTTGSGVGIVVLKKLSKAIEDGDRIIAVIKGHATNNDGHRKISYTAPSVIGQAECILNAQKMAAIASNEIDYVECHGTGTILGDPIEVQALKEAFNLNLSEDESGRDKCMLGAVKANIGHANSAAGIAGLIKVCSMLDHGLIPGQINFVTANPELHLENSCFSITTENKVWKKNHIKARIAGVSSFGIGGTNAHVIVSDYVDFAIKNTHNEEIQIGKNLHNEVNYILPLSAKSKKSLEKYMGKFTKYLEDPNAALPDIAYTLQKKREHFVYRLAIVAKNKKEAIVKLSLNPLITKMINEDADSKNKIIFMFPGQGSQYINMGLELYQNDKCFKETVDECIKIINEHITIDFAKILYPEIYGKTTEDINQTKWTQPALFIISYSLANFLSKINVVADSYIGHSLGEYVAATLAGVFSLEDALYLVVKRANLMQEMPHGSMLSIQGAINDINHIVLQHNCEIAVINSEDNCVAAGERINILALKKELDSENIPSVILNTSHAYHSRMMEKAEASFGEIFLNIKLNKPQKQFISNISGTYITNDQALNPEYWAKQIRHRVEFSRGIHTLCQSYSDNIVFIEVGAGKGLSSFVSKHNKQQVTQTIQLLPSKKEVEQGDYQTIASKEDIFALLWMNGLENNLNNSSDFTAKTVYDLPCYQFDSKPYWIEKSTAKQGTLELNKQNEMFYIRDWLRRSKFNAAPVNNSTTKNILLFSNELNSERVDKLVAQLRLQVARVIYVKHAIGEFQQNNLDIVMNFTDLAQMDMLNLCMQQSLFQNEITFYISSGTVVPASYVDVVAISNLNYAIYSKSNKEHKFISISYNNFEVLGSESMILMPSILHGISKSLPFKNTNVNSIHFDLDEQDDYTLIDFVDYQGKFDLLAIRNGYIWTLFYEKVTLESQDKNFIKSGDTILITDGFTEIGFSFTIQMLKRINNLRIVIIGRSQKNLLSEEELTRLNKMYELSENIIYVGFDIGNDDPVELQKILVQNNIEQLHCVLHSAGVDIKNVPQYENVSEIKSIILPKINGIVNIIQLAENIKIDYLINCSSISSVIPSFGSLGYATANTFLDEISYRKYKNIEKIITVNFNYISDIERDVNFVSENNIFLSESTIANKISSDEIVSILNAVVGNNCANVIISQFDIHTQLLQSLKEYKNLYMVDTVNSKIKIIEETYTDLEGKVAQIYCSVLGIEEISLHDDFFRIGGNSILAIKLVSKLNNVFDKKINVAILFKHGTIAALLDYILNNNMEEQIVIAKALTTENSCYPLSFAQERLWFIEEYEGSNNFYNIPLVVKINPEANLAILERTIQSVVSRHEILHSLIKVDKYGNGYQEVCDLGKNPLLIHKRHVENSNELNACINQEANYFYNLSEEYPIRIVIFNDSKDSYLSVVIHHIAVDGWSIDVFSHDVQAYYTYYQEQDLGETPNLDLLELSIQYKDFAIWQRNYLTGDRLEQQLTYWKNKLSGYETLNLPLDKQRPKQISYIGEDVLFNIDEQISNKLRGVARKLNVSLYSVLLSGYYILLSSYSNQDDVVIGTPIANRHYHQTESMIGFFVNTLALRSCVMKDKLLTSYIEGVGKEVVEAQSHQDLPFEKLVVELNVPQDTSRHPIFQVMFGVQNFGRGVVAKSKLLERYKWRSRHTVAQFDITTMLNDYDVEIQGLFNYATSLFNQNSIDYLITTYKYILEQIAGLTINDEKRIKDLSYLNKDDYKKVIYTWNQTEKIYPEDKTIYQLFEEQVERTPNNIAVVYENTKLTYKELNEKSNQLAHYLRSEYNIEGDNLIALLLDRSENMLIAILGVLKAGAAYVPMDPVYPDERIRYILEDTKAKAVLTNEIYEDKLNKIIINNTTNYVLNPNVDTRIETNTNDGIVIPAETGLHTHNVNCIIVSIDDAKFTTTLKKQPYTNPVQTITSQSLAYVIYTSGTTGKPKGVIIENSGVVNLAIMQGKEFGLYLSNAKHCLWYASYVFDAHASEIFTSIINGHATYIITNETRMDFNLLQDYIIKNKIDIATIPPALLNTENLLPLSTLVVAGEKTSVDILDAYIKKGTEVINAYGPTESTVCASLHHYISDDSNSNIGKPVHNVHTYVLGYNLNPLPIGAVGELYIGGVGLARGYLNQAELTQEGFIANPFQSKLEKAANKNSRLYKTGDLVRYLPDGNIEYIGRNDFQVKIRGFRIELGEIESQLSGYPEIKQAVVLAREHHTGNLQDISPTQETSSNSKYLVGYYVSETKIDETEILNHLGKQLPDYMVPSTLVWLEKLPLTINGKLDRKAMPDPEFTSNETYVAPRNELEKKVCKIFAEVLNLPSTKVGITDSFFRLGGDSIISIQLVSRLRQQLNLTVSVKDIFSNKTISEIYDNVISKVSLTQLEILSEQGILDGPVPLLPIQSWFWSKVESGIYSKPHHWNQSFLIKTPGLDIEILKESIIRLVAYHDSFRLADKIDDDVVSEAMNQKHRLNQEGDKLENNYISNVNATLIKAKYKQNYIQEVVVPELKVLDLNTLSIENKKSSLKDSEEVVKINKIKDAQKNISQNSIQCAPSEELSKILTEWQTEFDLTNGQAYSVGYIHGYSDNSCRVFFALHHLLVDAVSWRIIAHDLEQIYNSLALLNKNNTENSAENKTINKTNKLTDIEKSNSTAVTLKPTIPFTTNIETRLAETTKLLGLKGTSYRQWVTVITNYGIKHKEEINYWKNILHDYASTSKPILVKLIESEKSRNQAILSLDKKHTKQLLTKSNHAYNTQINDLLLSGLTLALCELTGKDMQHILLEGHGREEIDLQVDINHTVGWFTTMYPVRFELENKQNNIADVIKLIKENLREVPNKGIGYGAIHGYLEELPRISFNYLGQFDKQEVANSKKNKKSSSQFWSIVSEISGTGMDEANLDTNIININGGVIDGELQFSILSKLSEDQTKCFALAFKNQLLTIIEHTCSIQSRYYSINDFIDGFTEVYTIINETKNDTTPTVFFLPPGDRGYEAYLSTLVPHLKNHCKLILFNNYYPHIQKNIDVAIEDNNINFTYLAKFYIQYIKTIQPMGPYNLFGASFGGVLSFEIARQLEMIGDRVNFIGLLDSFFNYEAMLQNMGFSNINRKNDINSKYTPINHYLNKSNTKIVLYKATTTPSIEELIDYSSMVHEETDTSKLSDIQSMFGYFVNTDYNYIEMYTDIKSLKIVKIKSNHIGWATNDNVLQEITLSMKNYLV